MIFKKSFSNSCSSDSSYTLSRTVSRDFLISLNLWDFDGWARAYDEDVKRDAGVLKIYENYETVLQMVFEEVENFQRKDGKILEIGVR